MTKESSVGAQKVLSLQDASCNFSAERFRKDMEDFDGELLLSGLDDLDFNGLELGDLMPPSSDDDASMCRPGESGSLQDASLSLFPEPWTNDLDHATCTSLFDLEESDLDLRMTSLPSSLHLEIDGARLLDGPMEDLALFQRMSHLQVLGGSTGEGFEVGPGDVCPEKLQTGSIDINQSEAGKVINTAKGKSKKRRQRPVSDEERRERRKESNRRAADKYRKKQKNTTEATQKDYCRVVKENKVLKSVVKALQKELQTIGEFLKQHGAICPLGFSQLT